MPESQSSQGLFLRIYLSESDQVHDKPAVDAIIDQCRQINIHGITVLRGIEGVGTHGLHTSSVLSLSSHLPLIVEIVDSHEQINKALEALKLELKDKLVVTWPVNLIRT